ncbi:MAG: VOC family protein [Candidatus Humimicrobiaceae bacterium]
MKFDHIGLITNEKKNSESWVEATRVWVTNPKKHPFNVEWLRFESDSPVSGSLREKPHVAFRVKNLEEASKGLKILLDPFEVGGVVKAGFYELEDGSIVELMQYLGNEETWF